MFEDFLVQLQEQFLEEVDQTTIRWLNIIEALDSDPNEEVTIVGTTEQLWISEEALADIRIWGDMDIPQEPREKVNWRKEGF